MIKINLLPVQFRVAKKKKAKVKAAPQAPKKNRVSLSVALPWKILGISFGVLFLLITLFFDFDYIQLSKKMKALSVELTVVQPQLQALKALETDVTGTLIPEKDFLMTHVLNKAPLTTVLQRLSEALPDGMWLQSLVINNSGQARSFNVTGLAINIDGQTNIERIESFLQKVKGVIPNSKFTYSTAKQVFEKAPATAFNAEFKWQAD